MRLGCELPVRRPSSVEHCSLFLHTLRDTETPAAAAVSRSAPLVRGGTVQVCQCHTYNTLAICCTTVVVLYSHITAREGDGLRKLEGKLGPFPNIPPVTGAS